MKRTGRFLPRLIGSRKERMVFNYVSAQSFEDSKAVTAYRLNIGYTLWALLE